MAVLQRDLIDSIQMLARGMSGGPEKTIEVPNMGDSITEGTIKGWLKKVAIWPCDCVSDNRRQPSEAGR